MSDLDEIKEIIAKRSPDDQIMVLSIAMTLRNILKAQPQLAPLAYALVGAEMAAAP